MRKFLISAFAVTAMSLSGVSLMAKDATGDSDKAEKSVTGILIDNHCAADNKTEAAAAKHDKACAMKCGAKNGFALVHGDHVMKLDDKGNAMAMKYLETADSTKVMVMGTPDKDMTSMTVTDIKPADADKSKKTEKTESAK